MGTVRDRVRSVLVIGEVALALEGERPGVGVLVVEGDLARHLRLGAGEGRLFDGGQLDLQMLLLFEESLALVAGPTSRR